jgi:hypothetical protein
VKGLLNMNLGHSHVVRVRGDINRLDGDERELRPPTWSRPSVLILSFREESTSRSL